MRRVLRGADRVEAHLVGAQAQEAARVGDVLVLVAPGVALDPVLGPQPPLRQLAHGGRRGVVDGEAQLVAPAADRGQRVELVLAQEVRGEPVGVRPGAELGIGERVDLAVGLLERLRDAVPFEPVLPGGDLGRLAVDGMPEGHLGALGDGPVGEGARLAVGEADGGAVHHPQQAAGEGADQGVVEVALAPLPVRPGAPGEELPVQPLGLRPEHLVDVLDGRLELFELLGVVAAHGRRHALDRLAGGAAPGEHRLGAADLHEGGGPAQRILGLPDPRQPVRRHGELLDLLPAQPERGGPCLQGRVQHLEGALERHAGGEPGQFGQGGLAVDAGQGGDPGVGDLGVAGAESRDLAQRGLDERAEHPRDVRVRGQEGQQPGQSAQGVGVVRVPRVVRVRPVPLLVQGEGTGRADEPEPAEELFAYGVLPGLLDQGPAGLLPLGRGLGCGRGHRVREQGVPTVPVRHRPVRPRLADIEDGLRQPRRELDDRPVPVCDQGASAQGGDGGRRDRAPASSSARTNSETHP